MKEFDLFNSHGSHDPSWNGFTETEVVPMDLNRFAPSTNSSSPSPLIGKECIPSEPDLSNLSDEALHLSTERAARDEQRACLILLEHLIEVERRRLYAKKIFPSLHEYVRSLGYTDGQTQERIMAARLLRKIPEVKEAFEAKTLTLTTMAMLQRHSARETLPIATVKELVRECESLSTREVKKVLVSESTVEVPASDKILPVSKKLTRISLEVDDEFLALLERTKELKGNPGAGLAEIFTSAMKEFVKTREVKTLEEKPFQDKESDAKLPEAPSRTASLAPTARAQKGSIPLDGARRVRTNSGEVVLKHPRTRYIPAKVKNALRIRAGDRCERVDSLSGKRCPGRIGLEADHYPVPFAKGGSSTLDNLRWVCR